MSVFVLPPIYYAAMSWPREYGLTPDTKANTLTDALLSYGSITIAICIIYHGFSLGDVLPVGWGYDRLLAFLVGQIIFGILLFAPLVLVSTSIESHDNDEKIAKARKKKK